MLSVSLPLHSDERERRNMHQQSAAAAAQLLTIASSNGLKRRESWTGGCYVKLLLPSHTLSLSLPPSSTASDRLR